MYMSPRAHKATSKLASGKFNASASMRENLQFDNLRSPARRSAAFTILSDKSTPSTLPLGPIAWAASKATSPVPQATSTHGNGAQVLTDMPSELGGSGDAVTPGWLFRAGLASCLATSIAMDAAAEGIELTSLEVLASSPSDLRGLLGMADSTGAPVGAGPSAIQLRVRIAAAGVSPERLRLLVEKSNRCSPVSAAAREAVPVALRTRVQLGYCQFCAQTQG
jgi:uncharacterized OsmC-like protein